MGAHDGAEQVYRILNIQTLLLALAFLLPGLAPTIFGWMSGLLAIPVFCLLVLYGTAKGLVLVRNGALLATLGAIILNQLPGTLFSLTMVPLGISLKKSAAAREDIIRTGIKGFIILGISWFVFWAVYGIVQGENPYTRLLQILDTGFAQTFEVYKNSPDIPVETQVQFESLVTEVRAVIPRALPGILASTLLLTVWINLLGSITLLEMLKPKTLPWEKYRDWRLPEKTVWIPIVAGFVWIAGEGFISSAGLSLFIVSTLLFFFQGLAVLIFFMDRWNIPLYLKIIIYGILILQSYGLLMISIAGISDVWVDFRRKWKSEDQPDK
ncbi:MAG: DUF2232 domain-containing protein [Desulfobulbaceae bacterium]|nr:DUF2232 domain-containing protein [Desulfobulbaceae bacterium]